MSADRCCSCGQEADRTGPDGDSYCGRCMRDMESSSRPKARAKSGGLCSCGSGIRYEKCCMDKKRREREWRTQNPKHAMLN